MGKIQINLEDKIDFLVSLKQTKRQNTIMGIIKPIGPLDIIEKAIPTPIKRTFNIFPFFTNSIICQKVKMIKEARITEQNVINTP